MSGPAAAWWNADVLGAVAKWMLTRGREGTGDGTAPYEVGTLDQLYGAGGEWEDAPAWVRPTELPAQATEFDTTDPGFPVDGSFAARNPTTGTEFEATCPFVFVWTEEATRREDMDSACSWFDQRMSILVRVRRGDFTTDPSSAREAARNTALGLCRAVMFLMARDFPIACRYCAIASGEATGAFGVNHVTLGQEPTLTGNYGADGDTFNDAICSVLVHQLRSAPTSTSAG